MLSYFKGKYLFFFLKKTFCHPEENKCFWKGTAYSYRDICLGAILRVELGHSYDCCSYVSVTSQYCLLINVIIPNGCIARATQGLCWVRENMLEQQPSTQEEVQRSRDKWQGRSRFKMSHCSGSSGPSHNWGTTVCIWSDDCINFEAWMLKKYKSFLCQIYKIVSLVRCFFCIKCVFSMRISVIFNFSNESRICCSSLELAGGLVLYVTDFKNLFMLLTFI